MQKRCTQASETKDVRHQLWLIYAQLKDAESDPDRRLELLQRSREELGQVYKRTILETYGKAPYQVLVRVCFRSSSKPNCIHCDSPHRACNQLFDGEGDLVSDS